MSADPGTRDARAAAAQAARDALAAARHPAEAQAARVLAAAARGDEPDARDVERVGAALTLLFVTARADAEADSLRRAYDAFRDRFGSATPPA
jgi:hypothetical protein